MVDVHTSSRHAVCRYEIMADIEQGAHQRFSQDGLVVYQLTPGESILEGFGHTGTFRRICNPQLCTGSSAHVTRVSLCNWKTYQNTSISVSELLTTDTNLLAKTLQQNTNLGLGSPRSNKCTIYEVQYRCTVESSHSVVL